MNITVKIEIDGREVVNQKIEESKKIELKSYSPYARFFDETNPNWTKNAEYNIFYLIAQQNYANDMLKARGYLFLNEVYDMLGMPRTKAGQLVGWVYKENNTDGDNYVNFGIYRTEHNAKYLNGFENSVLLDFNVDGPIFDKI